MAIRKIATKIDLNNKYKYLIRDTSPFSDNLFGIVNFPSRFTAGKNLFKIRIDSTLFVENSQIHIEILDYNGNPIYWEPLNYVEKDGTRVIAVYIYPDTSPGIATVYVAGRVLQVANERSSYSRDYNSPNHADIPNAIWSRTIPIAPFASNDSEIIFTTQPTLTINEIVQSYLQPTDVVNVFTQITASNSSLTIEPEASSLTSANIIKTGKQQSPATEGKLSKNSPNFGKQFFDISKTQNALQNTGNQQMSSPVLTTLTGFSKLTTTNFALTKNMEGGTLVVNNANVIVPIQTGLNSTNKVIPASQTGLECTTVTTVSNSTLQLSGSYRFAISEVINSSSAKVAQIGGFKNVNDNTNGPFSIIIGTGTTNRRTVGGTVITTQPSTAIIRKIESSTSFTASFVKPTDVVVTQNSSSFADIIVANTEPATGDVYRIKTLYKPSGFFGDFIDLGDTILEQQNILIDTGSLETNVAVGSSYEQFGTFEDLNEINTYWTASSIGNLAVNALTIGYDQGTLMGGAQLVTNWAGANQYIASAGNATVFQIKPIYRPTVYADTTYIVKFQCALPPDIKLYSTDNGYIDCNRLDVYISGSQITVDPSQLEFRLGNLNPDLGIGRTLTAPFNDNGILGTRIGTIRATSSARTTALVEFEFKPLKTGPIDLKFVTRAGSWIIGAIEIIADKQTGFTPNYIRIFKRIPTEHLKTPLTFKFQYYDFRSNKADLETIAYGAIFNGGNVYIDGTNNLMTGSTYIGNTVGSGIQMSGQSSGYVRSVGYQGFTSASTNLGPGGFLMWSGSGNLIVGADTYEGVGLELIASSASYFRYRTNPSELDVRTDKFFFGNPNSTFISGSNGQIQISSSNFVLSPEGNVTASNALFSGVALANIIRDKTIDVNTALTSSYMSVIDINPAPGPGGVTNAVRLHFDGSLGGEAVRRLRLLAVTGSLPIGDIVVPVDGKAKTEVVIENGTSNEIGFYATLFGNPEGFSYAYPPPIVYLPAGRTVTLSTAGSVGTDIFQTAGSVTILPHQFKQGLVIGTGSVDQFASNGGRLTINSDDSYPGGTSFYGGRIVINQLSDNSEFQIRSAGVGGTGFFNALTPFFGIYVGSNVSPGSDVYLAFSGSDDGNRRRTAVNSGLHMPYSETSVNYTIDENDYTICTTGTAAAPGVTVTLPSGSRLESGRLINILHRKTAGLTIVANTGTSTIDGDSSLQTSTPSASIQLQCNGTGTWRILSITGSWT